MTFSIFCVGLVIIVAILGITGVLSYVMSDDTDETFLVGWFINGVCLSVCLTILLYQNGML